MKETEITDNLKITDNLIWVLLYLIFLLFIQMFQVWQRTLWDANVFALLIFGVFPTHGNFLLGKKYITDSYMS